MEIHWRIETDQNDVPESENRNQNDGLCIIRCTDFFWWSLTKRIWNDNVDPWFYSQAVSADRDNVFDALERYTWDEEFFWGIPVDGLSSRIWLDATALNDFDLLSRGPVSTKRSRHINDVYRALTTLPRARVVNEGLEVDLWRFLTQGERSVVQ